MKRIILNWTSESKLKIIMGAVTKNMDIFDEISKGTT